MRLVVRSINECVFAYRESEEEPWDSASPCFAAYVNENHPYIQSILKSALDEGMVTQFDGYQSGDPNRVYHQVYAIWNVFQRNGVKYSSITDTPSRSKNVLSQHVRLLDESIDYAQANCVDGSVMFASVMKKIGLDVALVLVPGHMFVAFYIDEQRSQLIGLETTLMGSLDLRPGRFETMLGFLEDEHANQQSWNSFVSALNVGSQTLLDKVAFLEDPDQVSYQLINLNEVREVGIMPLPYIRE
jgi:hypothetical protein